MSYNFFHVCIHHDYHHNLYKDYRQVPDALSGVPFSSALYKPETSALADLLTGRQVIRNHNTTPFKVVIAESRTHAKAFEQMAATKR